MLEQKMLKKKRIKRNSVIFSIFIIRSIHGHFKLESQITLFMQNLNTRQKRINFLKQESPSTKFIIYISSIKTKK